MKKDIANLHAIGVKLISQCVMGVLVLSVAFLCLSPLEEGVAAESKSKPIYYSAQEDAVGVSLMFNVYWGTEEVYRILDILASHDAKATFFIGGCWADDNVDCLKAIYAAGHELGNHGYFHKDHDKLNQAENQKEISACNQFIKLSVGVEPSLFAPPSGAFNDATLDAANVLRMTTILWSKDTIDWRDKNAALIYTRATKNVKVGDFILMHPMKETADALNDILKFYNENNLKPVTVSENLQKEG